MHTIEVNGEKYKVVDNTTINQQIGLPSDGIQYLKIGFWLSIGIVTGASTLLTLAQIILKIINLIIQ